MKDIFLSYSHEDSAWIKSFLFPFFKHNDLSYWCDVKNISGGASIPTEIIQSIRKCRKFLIILSEHSVNSPWVKFELDQTIALDPINESKKLVLLKINRCDIPDLVFNRKCIDFSTKQEDWDWDLLLESLMPPTDWGTSLSYDLLYGRDSDSQTLKNWLLRDSCRVIGVVGIGGSGKTALSVGMIKGIKKNQALFELSREIQRNFEFIIWRSLLSGRPATELVAEIIRFLSRQRLTKFNSGFDDQLETLLSYLEKHRCLIILDNLETVLQTGANSGEFKEEYLEYRMILEQISKGEHQSSLLFTSREIPNEIEKLSGEKKPVRLLRLSGLNWMGSKKVFSDISRSFYASEEDWEELSSRYSGNPLALKCAALLIQGAPYYGNVARFLKEDKIIFDDIIKILSWHYERLSDSEREVVYWLALNREPVSHLILKDDILSIEARKKIVSTLHSLQLKLPIEKSEDFLGFSLQPVLIEFLTDLIVDQICTEIETKEVNILNSHSLLKAYAEDYIREEQERLILKPVVEKLSDDFNALDVQQKLEQALQILHDRFQSKKGYAGGNLLNLLRHWKASSDRLIKPSLRNYNFSRLAIWQAYLADMELQNVDFSYSNFSKVVFTERFANIRSVAFSADGKYIASSGGDKSIHIWEMGDVGAARRYRVLNGHEGWILSIAFVPTNSNLIVSGGDDNTIRIWDIEAAILRQTINAHDNWVMSVAFCHQGRFLASGSADGKVKIWEISSETETFMPFATLDGHLERVGTVGFHPFDSNRVASGSEDGTVKFWEIDQKACLETILVDKRVMSIALTHKGESLAIGGEFSMVELWTPTFANNPVRSKYYAGHTGRVRSVAVSPDDRIIASGGEDETIKLWEGADCIKTLVGHSGVVRSVKFSPDASIIASCSDDRTIKLWDVSTGQCIKTLSGYIDSVRSLAFNQNDNSLLSGSADGIIRIWDTGNGNCCHRIHSHSLGIYSVACSHKGDLIASGGEDHIVKVWNKDLPRTGKILLAPGLKGKSHTLRIWSLTFSPDGKLLASGSEDQTIKLWDCLKKAYIVTLEGHRNGVLSVAFSPNNRFLASGSDDNTIMVWDVCGVMEGIKVKEPLRLAGHTSRVNAVAFAPNGKLLASGSRDAKLLLWDCTAWGSFTELKGHSQGILSICFSDDGRLLASGSNDGTIRVWNIAFSNKKDQCIAILRGHDSQINTIVFNHNGNLLATGSDNGVIKLWDCTSWKCLKNLHCEKPYEGTRITGATGLTGAQREALIGLGATDRVTHEV